MSEPTVCVSCLVLQAETIHCRLQLWTQTIRELVGLYRVICGPLKVICGTVLALYGVMCGPVKVMCGIVMPINL